MGHDLCSAQSTPRAEPDVSRRPRFDNPEVAIRQPRPEGLPDRSPPAQRRSILDPNAKFGPLTLLCQLSGPRSSPISPRRNEAPEFCALPSCPTASRSREAQFAREFPENVQSRVNSCYTAAHFEWHGRSFSCQWARGRAVRKSLRESHARYRPCGGAALRRQVAEGCVGRWLLLLGRPSSNYKLPKVEITMFANSELRFFIATTLLLLSLSSVDDARAQAGPPADARGPDRNAIASVMQSLAKSFEARDAKQLAALWTAEGEYQNDRGVDVHGRAALEKAFATVFAKTPEVTVELRSESLRFVSVDAAIEEGTVTIRRGVAEPATEAAYDAILVREGGHWLIAQLSDSSNDEASLKDLAWLIGDWKTPRGQDAEILTTYAWNPNKTFIRMQFSCTDKSLALTGDQMIGVDPATGEIRGWIFEGDGGIGESAWQRDGDHWTLTAAGVLADGSSLVETNVLRRIDDDNFTWQSIGRAVDDVALPDLPPIKVTRVKPQ